MSHAISQGARRDMHARSSGLKARAGPRYAGDRTLLWAPGDRILCSGRHAYVLREALRPLGASVFVRFDGRGHAHSLAETEVVFGLWVAALFLGITVIEGSLHQAVAYIESLNFNEPIFVVIIMVIAATVIDRRRSALILAHQVRKFAAIGEEQPASRFISRFAHGAKRRPT